MESEKVKEIKKALECQSTLSLPKCEKCEYKFGIVCKAEKLFKDALTLINELESENKQILEEDESLNGSWKNALKRIAGLESENETIKFNMQETEKANFNINQMNGNLVLENQQLKDRIAELENTIKNNLQYTKGYGDGVKATVEVAYPKKLNEFAERLKGKIGEFDSLYQSCTDVSYSDLIKQAIDETLKEFINE